MRFLFVAALVASVAEGFVPQNGVPSRIARDKPLFAVPTLSDWKILKDGSVRGNVKGHRDLEDGKLITTSPLKSPDKAGKNAMVRTTSGSQYKLAQPAAGFSLPGGGTSVMKKATALFSGGVPTLSNWRVLKDGSIQGNVMGHREYKEGKLITTSPIKNPEQASEDSLVRTTSGSRYQLAKPAAGIALPGGAAALGAATVAAAAISFFVNEPPPIPFASSLSQEIDNSLLGSKSMVEENLGRFKEENMLKATVAVEKADRIAAKMATTNERLMSEAEARKERLASVRVEPKLFPRVEKTENVDNKEAETAEEESVAVPVVAKAEKVVETKTISAPTLNRNAQVGAGVAVAGGVAAAFVAAKPKEESEALSMSLESATNIDSPPVDPPSDDARVAGRSVFASLKASISKKSIPLPGLTSLFGKLNGAKTTPKVNGFEAPVSASTATETPEPMYADAETTPAFAGATPVTPWTPSWLTNEINFEPPTPCTVEAAETTISEEVSSDEEAAVADDLDEIGTDRLDTNLDLGLDAREWQEEMDTLKSKLEAAQKEDRNGGSPLEVVDPVPEVVFSDDIPDLVPATALYSAGGQLDSDLEVVAAASFESDVIPSSDPVLLSDVSESTFVEDSIEQILAEESPERFTIESTGGSGGDDPFVAFDESAPETPGASASGSDPSDLTGDSDSSFVEESLEEILEEESPIDFMSSSTIEDEVEELFVPEEELFPEMLEAETSSDLVEPTSLVAEDVTFDAHVPDLDASTFQVAEDVTIDVPEMLMAEDVPASSAESTFVEDSLQEILDEEVPAPLDTAETSEPDLVELFETDEELTVTSELHEAVPTSSESSLFEAALLTWEEDVTPDVPDEAVEDQIVEETEFETTVEVSEVESGFGDTLSETQIEPSSEWNEAVSHAPVPPKSSDFPENTFRSQGVKALSPDVPGGFFSSASNRDSLRTRRSRLSEAASAYQGMHDAETTDVTPESAFASDEPIAETSMEAVAEPTDSVEPATSIAEAEVVESSIAPIPNKYAFSSRKETRMAERERRSHWHENTMDSAEFLGPRTPYGSNPAINSNHDITPPFPRPALEVVDPGSSAEAAIGSTYSNDVSKHPNQPTALYSSANAQLDAETVPLSTKIDRIKVELKLADEWMTETLINGFKPAPPVHNGYQPVADPLNELKKVPPPVEGFDEAAIPSFPEPPVIARPKFPSTANGASSPMSEKIKRLKNELELSRKFLDEV